MMRIKGQVAIVTGGSRGIGRAIVRGLGRDGAEVVIVARNAGDITRAVEESRKEGLSVEGIVADVTSESDVQRLVDDVIKKHSRIDILVNNAGMGVFKPVTDLAVSEFDTMWNTNMRGVFLLTKAALPHMILKKTGEIVNIASLAGKNSFKGGAGYCATKWALRGFAASMMLEVREHGIRVVTICPGSVETGFSASGKRGANVPQPEDVADAVIFALTAPRRSMFSEIDLRPTIP
jgi:NAD(P)-dependent dehydrogenase (short-subunit alcohol dehydrogenase family)